jgi:predicted MFS family arabinose efflux permease
MSHEKTGSLRALDALNFCNAGIQTGLGPFMAIFYTSVRHWHPGQIGTLVACQSLSGIAIQSVVGNWVDETHLKRMLTAAAAIVVALGAVGIAVLPSFSTQIVVQLVIGMAVTVFPAATSAFALGMVGKDELPGRIARNESVTHAGNTVFAIAAALVGTFVALQGIFYAAAAFASGMAAAAYFIRDEHVSHEGARAAAESEDGKPQDPSSFWDFFKDKRILVFAAAVVIFYFANAATLTLVGEMLSKGQQGASRSSAWQISSAVIVAEMTMIGVAALAGRLATSWGRKPLFLVAFAALALRNALTVLNHSPFYLIALQVLDGVAAAIYGVLLTLVTADLAKGTGRFNFLQGAIQSCMGLGGFLSNSLFGFMAKSRGFNASFWGLSGAAIVGGILYQVRMPETKPQEEGPDLKKRSILSSS